MPKLYTILIKKATVLASSFFVVFGAAGPALAKVPTDPDYTSQSIVWNQINAPAAWDITTGSRRIIVAVIDTGVDILHQDLRDNIWTNAYEIPNNGKDDDQNGYIDDVNGWNFVNNNNHVNPSVTNFDIDPSAVKHGTLISGIIGASTNNGVHGAGLNWETRIMPLRAVDSNGWGSFSDIARAVNYATNNGADIITMSFVGPDLHPRLKDSVQRAYSKGVVIISAAGNDRLIDEGNLDKNPLYPACIDVSKINNFVLTVSSVNSQDQLSSFSNFGKCVDLTAPGEDIFSTENSVPQNGYDKTFGGGWSGTSFTAPMAAGAAALIKSIRPTWGSNEIISTILDNADNIESKNLKYKGVIGRGRLNVGKAVAAAAKDKILAPISDRIYFYRGDKILTMNLAEAKEFSFARILNAEIKALTKADIDKNGVMEPIVLIKRGKFYYVRFFKESGDWWKSVSLKLKPSRSNGWEVKRIAALLGDTIPAATPLQPSFQKPLTILVEEYSSSNNITRISEHDLNGEYTGKDYRLNGVVEKFTTGQKTGVLALVQLKKGFLELRQVNWNSGSEFLWELSDVNSVEDISYGTFVKDKGERVVVITKGKKFMRYVVNVESGAYRFLELRQLNSKIPWRLAVDDWSANGISDIFLFNQNGGTFTVRTDKRVVLREFKLPAINGKIE